MEASGQGPKTHPGWTLTEGSRYMEANLPHPEGPRLQDRPEHLLRLPEPATLNQVAVGRAALAHRR